MVLFLLFEIGYANDHFRERIERVTNKQNIGSLEQSLPANANWANAPEQTLKQTTAQNINEYDMLLQGSGMRILNCADIGATGALAESILYKTNYFYRTGGYYIDSVEYTFYNSQLVELFKLMIRTNTIFTNDVRIVDFSYQLFTTNTTRREFTVLIHRFAPPPSPENRRFDFMIIDDQGTHLHTFADADAIMLYKNGNERKVITVDRAAVLDVPLTNNDTTFFRVWSVTAGTNAPTAIDLQATHKIGSKNLVNFIAPLWGITQIGSNHYYYFPHYELPYFIGTPAQGSSTPNNTGKVELFNISNSASFKQFTLPMPNWSELMRFSLGLNFGEYEFSTNVFSGNDKIDIFYGLERYIASCDCYQATYHVINEDGVLVRNLETLTNGVKKLADLPGQNPLYSMSMGTGDAISKFVMFDPITWELGTEFEAVHNGELLTLNYERIRYGEDYAIIFGMDAVISENGTKYGQINYYDKNGVKVRNIKLDIGPLGLAFNPLFTPATLNPYLFNRNGKLEFIGVAPRRVQEGSDAVTLRLLIFNEDADLLYFAEDTDDILSGAAIWTFNDGRTYSHFSLKYRTTGWVYSDYFYKLPFDLFDGGDGSIGNPYLISDAMQLDAVRQNLSANYKIVNDIDMNTFLNNNDWIPIGTPVTPFTGTIDGQNFIIKNLKLENISGAYNSLFGVVRGKIENMYIEDAEIISENNMNVSFVAGLMEQSAIIKNVHITGVIKLGSGAMGVGAIVADMNGSASPFARVEQCSFEGTIEMRSGVTLTNVHTGGIAGSLRNSEVINCLSRGYINVVNSASANAGVGGIVGSMRSNCLISNCYSNMDVTATNMVGGVVGRADEMQQAKGTIENCYATGRIIAHGTTNATFSGGVIGWSSDNNAHFSFDAQWNIFLNKTKLTMSGLVGLNDTVSAIAATSTPPSDLLRRARRVIGINANSGTNMTEFGVLTADSIRGCYALVTMAVGQAGNEVMITSTNPLHHDGADVAIANLNQAFLAGIGWQFGSNSQNPWVWVENEKPKLWFEVAVQSVTLDAEEITLYVDETHLLTATVLPDYAINKNVTWTSNNEAIATVEEGFVTAVAAGTAIITVITEDGGLTATCTVNVLQKHILTLQVNPTGTGTATGEGEYAAGVSVTVNATPYANYEFVAWMDGTTQLSTNETYTFNMPAADITYTATFQGVNKSIVVESSPAEGGTITGAGTYRYGTQATLTANPNPNYKFVNWTEDGVVVETNSTYSFIVTDDRVLIAHFILDTYTVICNTPNNGTLIITSDGVTVPSNTQVDYGTVLTITATPDSNYVLISLTVNGADFTNGDTYTVISATYIIAAFAPKQGISDIKATDFTIYPNPVSDVLRLVRSSSDKVNVEIYDNNGSLIRSFETNETEAQINVASLASGVYFIRFVGNQTVSSQRFIKQ